jgi:hypothetical protein
VKAADTVVKVYGELSQKRREPRILNSWVIVADMYDDRYLSPLSKVPLFFNAGDCDHHQPESES